MGIIPIITASKMYQRVFRIRDEEPRPTPEFQKPFKEAVMPDKFGTENLEKVISCAGDIVELAIEAFKDGIQFTDVTFIPKAVGKAISIGGAIPGAIKEAADLSLEEVGEIISLFVSRVLMLFKPGGKAA